MSLPADAPDCPQCAALLEHERRMQDLIDALDADDRTRRDAFVWFVAAVLLFAVVRLVLAP